MELSKRITGLLGGGDDGWGVFLRARKMVAEGIPVTELTIGEHDIGTDTLILDEMHRAARAGHTGYADVPGIPALRRAIAERVTRQTGVATGAENVLVTAGAQAGLLAAHAACADPGDTALFLDPYYTTYPGTLRAVGARPRAVATRPELGFQPEASAIRAAAEATGAKSLLINTPNNPTGVVYTPQTMAEIADTCGALGMWLISDEVYDTQVWQGQHQSAWALPELRSRCLVVNSMSKSFAMTGSRVGWILGPAEAIAHLSDLSTHTTYGVPGFIQDAALFALGLGPEFEAGIAAPFRRRRAIAARLLAATKALHAVPSDGAMYVMLDIRATGLSGEGFASALLEEERIAVMPGESFGQAAAGHIRVAMTVEDARFEDALARLIRFAEAKAAARQSSVA
jgi:arginine:pyruvate transaminase